MKKGMWISIVVALIFIVAFGIRYISYQDVGITLDEPFYVKGGLYYVQAAANMSFFSQNWSFNYEHPPVSKYIYGVAEYLFNGGKYDGNAFLIAKTMSIICGAITCVLIYLTGRRFFNEYVGILAALILAFTPMMIAHNQLSNIDSPVTMMLTATMYVYLRAMRAESFKLYLASAVLLGLSLGTKYNSLLIIPVMIGSYLLYRYYNSGGKLTGTVKDMLAHPPNLPLIGLSIAIVTITFFAIWPYLWTNPIQNMQLSLAHWSSSPLPESLLGTSIQGVPLYYYPAYFLVTTPEILLIAMVIGLLFLVRCKDSFKQTAALWLFLPFAYGLSHFVMGSMRYILIIYPGLALVCAYGIYSVSGLIGGRIKNFDRASSAVSAILGLSVVVSLLLTCAYAQPLYLDYYNSLAGGYQNIYDHKLFILSWWGEGVHTPVEYLETHTSNATVSIVASMIMNTDDYVSMYAKNNTYTNVMGMGGGPAGTGPEFDGNLTTGAMPAYIGNASGSLLGAPTTGNMNPGQIPSQDPGSFNPGDSRQPFQGNQSTGSSTPPNPGSGMGGFGGNSTSDMDGAPGGGQINIGNLTTDYIIVGTNTGSNSSVNQSNYTLVYQSIFHGVELYDVYKRI